MSDPRFDPRGIRPDGDEGDVAQIVDGVVTFAPITPVATPEPIVTVVGGVPGLLFDNDGRIVKREISP